MGMISWFTGDKKRKQSRKKNASSLQRRPEMEVLEDRCVPSTIPVYTASAPVISGDTVTQTLSFPASQPTTLQGAFAQFNTSLGTLNSITILQNGTISSDIQVENLSATSSANISGSVNGTLSLQLAQNNTTLNSISPNALAGTYLAAANPNFVFPNFNFNAPYGTDFLWQNASAQGSTSLSGASMSPFIGGGTVTLNEVDQATSTATSAAGSDGSNGGNIDVYVQSKAWDTVTIVYNFTPSADLAITKVATPTSVPVGNSVTYTMTVTNNGPNTANGVVVTDPLPAGVNFVSDSGSGWTFSMMNGNEVVADLTSPLAYQASASFTITVSLPTAGTFLNTATVSSSTPDPNLANNVASASVTAYQQTDVTITKTGSPNPVLTNGTLTYTLTVSNIGSGPATQVSVVDPLPAGTTFLSGSGNGWSFANNNGVITANDLSTLGVGSTSTFTISVLAPNSPGTITNTATVSTTTPETNYNNNTASVQTQVIQPADVTILKTANPSSVQVNGTLTYTLTVTNLGPGIANQVVVSDPLPFNTTFLGDAGSDWTISNSNGVITANLNFALTSGASDSFTITVQAPPTAPNTITNTATVSTSTPETNYNNNTSTVVTPVIQTDDLAITKTASVASVEVGNAITYTLTVSNLTGATANQVIVTDTLPAGETFMSALGPGWTITNNNGVVTATTPSLPVGISSFFTITVQAPLVAGTVTNTATVTSSTPDVNLANNTSSATTIIINPPGTTYTQNLPPVKFGAIPIIYKSQLMGIPLPAGQAALMAQIVSVYLTLTGQAPSAATVSSTVTQIQSGKSSMQGLVNQLWLSTAHLTQEIDTVYQTFLGRNPTTAELTTNIALLKKGGSEQTIATNLLTSQEFLQAHPNSMSMVATLDIDVLDAVPDLASLTLSVQSLSTTTWSAYVKSVLSSSSALNLLVTNGFEGILDRPPTSTELQTWTTKLANNQVTPDQFLQQLLASSEFGQLAYANS